MVDLGNLEEVPVRDLWSHEAHKFTPWLADNLSLLSEVLGLNLELKQTEAPAGIYSLDLLAKDTFHDCNVAIENQLEGTNHVHLGQLITYATAHDARIAIWVSPGFQPEHRAAIDWLNKWMSEEIDFYGVEVRAIRIDDSRPAVEFRPVAYPEWWNQRNSRGRGAISQESQENRLFFQPLIDRLKADGWNHVGSYSGNRSQSFDSGFRSVTYMAQWYEAEAIVVQMWMNQGSYEGTKELYDAFHADVQDIESELGLPDDFGTTLHWDDKGRHAYACLWVQKTGVDWEDESTHDDIREWMRSYLEAFYGVFKHRLERITGETDSYDE